MPSRWPSELRHGAWLACMVEALSTEFSTYSELQATGTSTPKAFISVLLAIALPVILNGPQDNETPAGLRDVLSVMTGLGAEPRNVRPEGVHCRYCLGLSHRPGCTDIPRERSEWSAGSRFVNVILRDSCKLGIPPASVRLVSEVGQAELVTSKRQAAAACNVTPIVVRRWLARGWLPEPPWTLQQLHDVRDLADPDGRLRGPGAAHGTETRWTQGCNCDLCCKAKTDAVKGNGRRKAHKRLPVEVRQQLLDAISAGRPFRATIRDLGLTTNQVWGLTKTDQHWAAALEAALMGSRRDDLNHGTNAAYVHGCVCSDCRGYQRIRMDNSERGKQEDADQRHSTGDV